MISVLSFLDSISEEGAPPGMVCLHQLAIDIAMRLHPAPKPQHMANLSEEEKKIAESVAVELRAKAESAHLEALKKWVANERITGISATTRAPITDGNFIYIRQEDANKYLESCGLAVSAPELIQVETTKKHEYRQPLQEKAIIAKLKELGFDTQALPPYPKGKSSPAKKAVKTALGYSKDVMNKAWHRLRTDGAIKDT